MGIDDGSDDLTPRRKMGPIEKMMKHNLEKQKLDTVTHGDYFPEGTKFALTKPKQYIYTVSYTVISNIISTRGIPAQTTVEYKSLSKKFLDKDAAHKFRDKISEAYSLVLPNGLSLSIQTEEIEG